MERIKVNTDNMNNVYWALIQAIQSDTDINKGTKIIEIANQNGNDLKFDFELKINGIEVSFKNIVDELINRENFCIERAVKQVVENKMFDIVNKANDIIEDLGYIDLDLKKLDKGV